MAFIMNRTSALRPWTAMATTGGSNLYHHTLSRTLDPETDVPYTYDDYYDGNFDSVVFSCDYGDHGATALPVLYSLFFAIGFLSNTLVIRMVKLRSLSDIGILNLALANLLFVSSLPFLAHYSRDQWIFGEVMCTLVLSVYHIGFYSGIFFIVLMAIERYLVVVHADFALRIRSKTYGISVSAVTWVAAVSASFPELMHLQTTNYKEQTQCTSFPTDGRDSNLYSRTFAILKMNVLGLILPVVAIGFCYSMILKKLLTTSRKQPVWLVVASMVVFFCCWVPYNATAFVKALEQNNLISQSCDSSKKISLCLQITEALAYSHCCLNPMFCVFVRDKFRRRLFRFLYKTPCCRFQFTQNDGTPVTASVYSHSTNDEKSSTTV